jgi:hypothetical protein
MDKVVRAGHVTQRSRLAWDDDVRHERAARAPDGQPQQLVAHDKHRQALSSATAAAQPSSFAGPGSVSR